MFKHCETERLATTQRHHGRGYVIALIALLAASQVAFAQQPTDKTTTATSNATAGVKPATTPGDIAAFTGSPADRYRIGPGDVLDIHFVNRPNLSRDAVRVEGDGMIRMPLIETSIQASCQTETELAKDIANRYTKFYREPQIEVFIKEYHARQVAIIGIVGEQGRFQLQRRIRLLELLTYAKGPGSNAGQTINVIHSETAFQCNRDAVAGEDLQTGLASYKLSDTMRGDDKANPFLENGDIVTLPEADQVWVVGNVMQPRAIPLKEPITVTTAIAMSGGLNKDTKKDRIRIVRREPGSTSKKEIYVDLAAIEKKQAEDLTLVANDIVDVPISGARSLIRSVVTGLGSSATQLPLRVVP
jgi:polysaccharide export outer membrane protein